MAWGEQDEQKATYLRHLEKQLLSLESQYDLSEESILFGTPYPTFMLRYQILAVVQEARRLDSALTRLPDARRRNLFLLESQRLSYQMQSTERPVYRRNISHPPVVLTPVRRGWKVVAYMVMAGLVVTLLALVIATCTRRSFAANEAVLQAFLVLLVLRLLLIDATRVLVWHVFLPETLRYRLGQASQQLEVFRYSSFLPLDTPACLVAVRRPELASSSLIIRAMGGSRPHDQNAGGSLGAWGEEQERWFQSLAAWQRPPSNVRPPPQLLRWLLAPLCSLPDAVADAFLEAAIVICLAITVGATVALHR